MRQSLRVRLLVIVLFGMALLAGINLITNRWQLFRVRDQAIDNSSVALRQQADSYLQSLASVRADGTSVTLGTVRQIAEIMRDHLAREEQLVSNGPSVVFQTAADGRRYSHGEMTIILPATGDEQAIQNDVQFSQYLDMVLPSQARRVPEIVRISYLTPRGVIRTFPILELDSMPSGWSIDNDPTFQLSLPRNNLLKTTVWSEPHLALDNSEQVLSAITPIYRNNQFAGAIIVDVSMNRLTGYLERLRIGQSGFAFLLANNNQLVAAPEAGQQQLIGRTLTPLEQVQLDRSIPGLEPALLAMSRGQNGVTTITLDNRPYLLAYAPIATISWNQVLAVPLDEVTAGVAQTTQQITVIADDAQLFGLLAALLAVALIGLIITFVLRRQFVRPLAYLINATQSVAAGDLHPIEGTGDDEIGQLTASFNTMTSSLKESRDEILATNQSLEQTVRERTHDLRGALQVAEDANRMKTQFLANMSHELRTPLNAILNFSEMIGLERFGGILTERQQDLQRRILHNSEHLLGLINDILDLSKIEAGCMDLFYDEVDLGPMLKGVMSTLVGLTSDKGLSIVLEAPEELPKVWIDKTRIRQVLLNLLSNAAKFTEQGGITIRVVAADQHVVEIAIEDTGIGIAPEHQGLIFEEFRQVQGDMTRAFQGTGLGLPISKRLVEMHGGKMWLESTLGVGSIFRFTIPTVRQQEAPDPALDLILQPEDETAEPPTGPLVVVIDDDPNAQQILRWYLEDAGYRVDSLLDSRDALAYLCEHQPKLIILDINMPFITGWDLLSQIKMVPEIALTPVIICTVLDQQRVGIFHGANGYINKPVRREDLMSLVNQWIAPHAPILVIDDNPDSRRMIRVILEESGYQVREATTGQEGLDLLQEVPPALIILDLMMPIMDGFTFLIQLRGGETYAHLPVIVITARDLSQHERDWLLEHTQHYISKSQFSVQEFIHYARKLLNEPAN